MDRRLKVYCNAGYTFADVEFSYDKNNRAGGKYTSYRVLYVSDDDDKTIHTYEMESRELYLHFRKFNSQDELKAHDINAIKEAIGRDMTDPAGYSYIYEPETVQQRYFIGMDHRALKIGMANISYNFGENTREIKFFSGDRFRDDFEMTTDFMDTNMDLLNKVPLWDNRGEPLNILMYDMTKIDQW